VSAPDTSPIQAVVLDVDGVLTDGSIYLAASGEEMKRISFTDVMGISLGRRAGLRFALVSGEGGPVLELIARRLQITDVYAGCKDKAAALRSYAESARLELKEICFMGDDVNDLPAMALAGLRAAPAGAHASVRKTAQIVTERGGGQGAVRELVDRLLENAGR
jgi:3-deoxy-D-manno-octulosonate 8-phosphate phosphatase (KDO 8-P phosphatase)